jgi:hypothetical protein
MKSKNTPDRISTVQQLHALKSRARIEQFIRRITRITSPLPNPTPQSK